MEQFINTPETPIRHPLRPSQLKKLFAEETFKAYVAMGIEEAEEADVDTKLYVLGRRISGELFQKDYITYRDYGIIENLHIFAVSYTHV